MTNFIFKSGQAGLVKKFAIDIEVLLNEQRHQRSDLASIIRRLVKIDSALVSMMNQKQVDDFYETSPQTDRDEQTSEQV